MGISITTSNATADEITITNGVTGLEVKDGGVDAVKTVGVGGSVNLSLFGWTVDAGTWGFGNGDGYASGVYFSNVGSHAINDAISTTVYLTAGTYVASFHGCDGSVFGILDIKIDSVSVDTIDMYSGSGDNKHAFTGSAFVIAESGFKDIQLIVDDKNASSSNYHVNIQTDFILTRTV